MGEVNVYFTLYLSETFFKKFTFWGEGVAASQCIRQYLGSLL